MGGVFLHGTPTPKQITYHPHDVDPAAAVDCPVGQTEQVVWPVVDVKVPTAQAVHVCPVPL